MLQPDLSNLPMYQRLVGPSWLANYPTSPGGQTAQRPCHYVQLEADLCLLRNLVGEERLIECYRDKLRCVDPCQVLQAMHEIHGVTLLGQAASKLTLHVLRGDGSKHNFDAQAVIEGCEVNADVKTRRDEFPFTSQATDEVEDTGVPIHWRPTVDEHETEDYGLRSSPNTEPPVSRTPENKNIRDLLLGAVKRQLPVNGINVVLLGHTHGDRQDLEFALEGAPVLRTRRGHDPKIRLSQWGHLSTGAFTGSEESSEFRAVSAVLWFRLMEWDGQLFRGYKLYVHEAANDVMPGVVVESLRRVLETLQALAPGGEAEPVVYRVPVRRSSQQGS